MSTLKVYLGVLLAYGFIYFIGIRIFNNKNFKKLAVFTAIYGGVLTTITILCLVVEIIYPYFDLPKFKFISSYYAFIEIAVLYNIILPVIFLLTGKNRHQQYAFYTEKKNNVKLTPTLKEKVEFVYVAFKHNGNFLLRKVETNGETLYAGYYVKLTSKQLFQDEMVKDIIKAYDINSDRFDEGYELVGEITKSEGLKSESHYYCYVIEVNDKNEKFNDYYEISPYELVNYKLSDFDKQVLYHVILKEKFNIKL